MVAKTVSLGKLQLRLHWLVVLCVALAVSGFMRLGLWQLERANEKLQLQARFELKQQDGPANIQALPLAGLEADALQLQNTLVLMQGQYLNTQSILMIYQPFKDQIGYEIVTPFKLASENQIVLVSRGWVAAAPQQDVIANLANITGQQQLTGQIYVPTAAMVNKPNNLQAISWPLVVRYLNTLELAPEFDLPLFPYVVRLNEGQAGVLLRHWPAVRVDTGRNQAYALQWFAMAIAVVMVSLILCSNILTLITERSKPL